MSIIKSEFYFNSNRDNITPIHCISWRDDSIETRGIVQLIHGMEEHIDRYDHFARFLCDNGFIVVGHDHLGHGKSVLSDEDYGFFAEKDGWSILMQDVHTLYETFHNEYKNLPYFIFAHSMGSILLRHYLTIYNDQNDILSGAIISGTNGQKFGVSFGLSQISIIKKIKGAKKKSHYVERLVGGSFNKFFAPNKTDYDWVCTDEESLNNFINDDLCNRGFSISAYADMVGGVNYLKKQSNVDKTQKIPMLLISGEKDPVGEMGFGVLRVYKALKKAGIDVSFTLFKNGRHEMINDVQKDAVFSLVLDFIVNHG